MKILITGGAGYIGSKLSIALVEKGHDVQIFDKPQNIVNKLEVDQAMKGKDICYHLAALAEIAYTDAHPQETFEVNIVGTNNIASACAKNNVLLNFTSTSCIYGDPLEYPSREEGLINPSDTYAMSKASGEYLVKMWGLAEGLKYNILRFGTVYGQSTDKEMRGDMAIQIFLDKAIKREVVTIKGDGQQSRNFIHIDDLVAGLVAVTEKGVKMETINLAGKESISINDIMSYVLMLGASGVKYAPERKDDFRYQNVYLGKAKKLLDWEPKVRFEDGIKSMYDWLKVQ